MSHDSVRGSRRNLPTLRGRAAVFVGLLGVGIAFSNQSPEPSPAAIVAETVPTKPRPAPRQTKPVPQRVARRGPPRPGDGQQCMSPGGMLAGPNGSCPGFDSEDNSVVFCGQENPPCCYSGCGDYTVNPWCPSEFECCPLGFCGNDPDFLCFEPFEPVCGIAEVTECDDTLWTDTYVGAVNTRTLCATTTIPMGSVAGGRDFKLEANIIYNDARPAPQELYSTPDPSTFVANAPPPTCPGFQFNDWYGIGGWLSVDEFITDEGVFWADLNDASGSNPRSVLQGAMTALHNGRDDLNGNGTIGFTLHTPYYDKIYDDPEVLQIDDGDGSGAHSTPVFASTPFDGQFLRVRSNCVDPSYYYENNGLYHQPIPLCYEIGSFPGGPWKTYAYPLVKTSSQCTRNPRLAGQAFVNGQGNNPAMLLSSIKTLYTTRIGQDSKQIYIARRGQGGDNPPILGGAAKLQMIYSDLRFAQEGSGFTGAPFDLYPEYGYLGAKGFFQTSTYPATIKGPTQQYTVLFGAPPAANQYLARPAITPVIQYNHPGINLSTTTGNGVGNGERTTFSWSSGSNEITEIKTSLYSAWPNNADEVDDLTFARPEGLVDSMTVAVQMADNPKSGKPSALFQSSTDVVNFLGCGAGGAGGTVSLPAAAAGGSATTTRGALVTYPRGQSVQYLYGDVTTLNQLAAFTDAQGVSTISRYDSAQVLANGAKVPQAQWALEATASGTSVQYQSVGAQAPLQAFPPGTFVQNASTDGTSTTNKTIGVPLINTISRLPDQLALFSANNSYDVNTLLPGSVTDQEKHTLTVTYDNLGNVMTVAAGNGIVSVLSRAYGLATGYKNSVMDTQMFTRIGMTAAADKTTFGIDAYGFFVGSDEPFGSWVPTTINGTMTMGPTAQTLTTQMDYRAPGVPYGRVKTLGGSVVESMTVGINSKGTGFSSLNVSDASNTPIVALKNVATNNAGSLSGPAAAQLGHLGGELNATQTQRAGGDLSSQGMNGNTLTTAVVASSVGAPAVTTVPQNNGNITSKETNMSSVASPTLPTKCIGAN